MDDDDPPGPHDGWPWRSWGCEAMTRQRATAEAVYAVAMAQAAERGELDHFEARMQSLLRPTSAVYQRSAGDWSSADPVSEHELAAAVAELKG